MEQTVYQVKRVTEYLLSRIAALLLISMTAMVLIQVVSRYLFNSPTAFTEELVRYLLIWTGFIGAAYAFSTRQHMALTFFRDRFSEERRRYIITGVDALVLLFAIFIMIIGGGKLMFSVARELSPLLGISRSVVYAMAPISGVFIVIIQCINLYEDLKGHRVSAQGVTSC